ncbi:hypothetical protein N7471_010457 [Penicillium samsonianum]|uniref:uncharacterized protein n=1 Tax=Penicillium samsonianum TaxID=1882272 RepID=UPI0025487964|nr:uncharacterized protein N7471_010457 [Penicillium samsonianum]KAJ6125964.1 hypothetical protein N7471_010457 [Penicillium samsonianum]
MSNNQAFSNSQASLDQGSQLATLIAQVGSNRKPLPRHNNEVENYLESERETADEEKDVQHPQENLDPISDDEENPRIESREVEINAHVATGLNSGREQLDLLQGSSSEGEEVLGITRESGDDDDGEHPLPRDHSLKRSSGRDVQVGGRGPLGPPTGHQKGVQTRPWTGLDMSIDGSIGLWRGLPPWDRALNPPTSVRDATTDDVDFDPSHPQSNTHVQRLPRASSQVSNVTVNGQLTEFQASGDAVPEATPKPRQIRMTYVAEILLGLFVPWGQLPALFQQHANDVPTKRDACSHIWKIVELTLTPHIRGFAANIELLRQSREDSLAGAKLHEAPVRVDSSFDRDIDELRIDNFDSDADDCLADLDEVLASRV